MSDNKNAELVSKTWTLRYILRLVDAETGNKYKDYIADLELNNTLLTDNIQVIKQDCQKLKLKKKEILLYQCSAMSYQFNITPYKLRELEALRGNALNRADEIHKTVLTNKKSLDFYITELKAYVVVPVNLSRSYDTEGEIEPIKMEIDRLNEDIQRDEARIAAWESIHNNLTDQILESQNSKTPTPAAAAAAAPTARLLPPLLRRLLRL